MHSFLENLCDLIRWRCYIFEHSCKAPHEASLSPLSLEGTETKLKWQQKSYQQILPDVSLSMRVLVGPKDETSCCTIAHHDSIYSVKLSAHANDCLIRRAFFHKKPLLHLAPKNTLHNIMWIKKTTKAAPL